ncbi:MAG: mechanosensitive ion channel family protein [Myxococcota bacterium]
MREVFSQVQEFLSGDQVQAAIQAVLIVVVGYVLWRLLRRRLEVDALRAQQNMILRRVIGMIILIVTVAWALSTLGFDLKVVLGAAGVLTVAIGFAAQTSVSNLISGLFLMAERPFQVGDSVEVGSILGEVMSIDSLSVKIRTFNNLMVRIPNETMLKANVTNLTHFELRRCDMAIGVAYKDDIEEVREILLQVAYDNPLCLVDPKPLFMFLGFGDSALQLQFSVWSTTKNFLEMRTTMYRDIKRAFDAGGIEIPFPQRVVHVDPSAGQGDAAAGLVTPGQAG